MNFAYISKHRLFLYGFAALWIMFFHFCTKIPPMGILTPLRYIQDAGACGVDMFLLLSGFGLYNSMAKCTSAGEFYKKRFLRVYLPAVMVMSLYYILMDDSVLDYLACSTFLGYWIGMDVEWFIGFIMTMYLIYPFLYMVQKKKSRIMYLFLMLSLTFSFLAETWYVPMNLLRGISRIPIFLFGCILAPCFAEKKQIPKWVFPAAVLISICLTAVWAGFDLYVRYYRYYFFLHALLFFAYSVVLVLLLCSIAEWFLHCKFCRGIYRCIAFCGVFSLEIYLLYERALVITEFLPGFESDPFSFVKRDLASIAITLVFSVVLQQVTRWVIAAFESVKLPKAEV